MAYGKKFIDSLFNEEVFSDTNEEILGEKKPPWLDTSVTANALSARERTGLGVSDTLADVLSDELNTFE